MRCLLGAALICAAFAQPARADEPPSDGERPLTLELPGLPGSWIRPSIRADAAMFSEIDAWGGNSREIVGDHVGYWGEFGVVPGLDGQLALPHEARLRARVSAVYTTTQFGLDAAGSNFDDRHPYQTLLEDAYLGWSSGEIFSSLGTDAIDLSIGAQPYQVGTGFLFHDGSTDGGPERGGYWIGLREAFRFTTIARLTTGPLLAEATYLKPYDQPNSSTEVAGANLEYGFGDRGTIGAGYWNVLDSDDERRDGLDVFDLRFDAHPFAGVPGLGFAGEIVRELNGSQNNSWGGYGEVSYDFGEDVFLRPYLEFRYAAFGGDDGDGDNRAFDPLFYGASDWNQWYLGEIAGEFVATNRNLTVYELHLRANPTDAIALHLFYIFFHLQHFAGELTSRPPSSERVALIESKSLASEIDFIVDWEVSENLRFSGVAAFLIPSSGVKDAFESSSTWSHFLLQASISF